MQLACPACHTAFHVDSAVLGPEGRTVRCARCRNTWFATVESLLPDSAVPAMAEAGTDGGYEDARPGPPVIQPPVAWNDMVMVEVNPGPPLAPGDPAPMSVPAILPAAERLAGEAVKTFRRKGAGSGRRETRLGVVALLLGLIALIGFIAREPLVRAMPNLAGFYAAIGVPVNLRGIEFQNLRTSLETQDGATVLVIEGELVNPARYARDLPRLRLAVHGADEQELYNWTALMPRETLGGHESFTFRSRLASPPEGSARVSVRFLSRYDLTNGGE